MYAIAGVSGNTGSVAADTLLSQGKPVRVIVRSKDKGEPWRARGAEVAIAELGDSAALTAALAGTQGAYLLLPPVPTAQDPLAEHVKLTASIAKAVRDSGVPHVVLLSSTGAQHAEGTGPIRSLYHAERELAATGAALTAIRASYFQDNWGGSLGTLATGTIYSFVPNELAFPQVSTRDIGRVAAAALVEGAPKGTKQIIELGGPRDVSGHDVAAALSQITGKPITVQVAPLEAVVPTFTGFGLSTAMAELYREMYAGIISGHVSRDAASSRVVKGTVGIEDSLRRLLSA